MKDYGKNDIEKVISSENNNIGGIPGEIGIEKVICSDKVTGMKTLEVSIEIPNDPPLIYCFVDEIVRLKLQSGVSFIIRYLRIQYWIQDVGN